MAVSSNMWVVALGLVIGCGEPRWERVAAMQHPRAAHAVVATQDTIVALAGIDGAGAPVLAVERFDGAAWVEETVLPGRGRNAPAAVALDGDIYVLGGFDTTSNVPVDIVDVYAMGTRRWSVGAPLPTARGGHAAVVLAGRIHVIGGGNSRSTIADHDVFDPSTGGWSARAGLPRAAGSVAAVVHAGKLFAIGGRSGGEDFGAVDVYDPATDAWTPGPAIAARGTAGAVEHCGAVIVVGGESQARLAVLAEVLRLDGATWRPMAPLPTARSFARAVAFRGATYVVGGGVAPQTSHAPEGSAVVERLGCR